MHDLGNPTPRIICLHSQRNQQNIKNQKSQEMANFQRISLLCPKLSRFQVIYSLLFPLFSP